MSLILPINFFSRRIKVIFILILLVFVGWAQNESNPPSNNIETISNNKEITINESSQTKHLIKDNDLLQFLNRYYLFIGIILIGSLFVAIGFIYHLWNQRQIIKKQNALLAQVNATKNQFFSIIAHDLRGPVVAFQNLSKKINYLNKKGNEGDVNKMLHQVDLAAKNLNVLLDNLLSWSLVQENAFPYQPTFVNLKELSTEIYQLYLPLAKSKGIKLKQHIFADFIVNADRNSLSTIIRNLISNAIKFSNAGDEVRIIAKKSKDKIELRIEDTGIGIPPDIQTKLFFLNEEKLSEGTKGEKGTGLGLVLCKNFVDLNKGEIFVKSQLGKGTLFSISLPI